MSSIRFSVASPFAQHSTQIGQLLCPSQHSRWHQPASKCVESTCCFHCTAAGACAVSEWGPFTPCSRTGLDHWAHSHSRAVQQPAADCPTLTETLSCGECSTGLHPAAVLSVLECLCTCSSISGLHFVATSSNRHRCSISSLRFVATSSNRHRCSISGLHFVATSSNRHRYSISGLHFVATSSNRHRYRDGAAAVRSASPFVQPAPTSAHQQ